MIITGKKVIETIAIIEAFCDKCGKYFSEEQVLHRNFCIIRHDGGYYSEWPADFSSVECVLCEPCLKEMISEFAQIKMEFQ